MLAEHSRSIFCQSCDLSNNLVVVVVIREGRLSNDKFEWLVISVPLLLLWEERLLSRADESELHLVGVYDFIGVDFGECLHHNRDEHV